MNIIFEIVDFKKRERQKTHQKVLLLLILLFVSIS